MVDQIRGSLYANLCREIPAIISTVYRPITLADLTPFVDTLEDLSEDHQSLADIVRLCGSFLTLRNDTVYFVHQSAKDFLLKTASVEAFFSRIASGV